MGAFTSTNLGEIVNSGFRERFGEADFDLLRHLVNSNYDGLTEHNGAVCKELVLRYLSMADNLVFEYETDIDLIKRLTKVAKHMLDEDPEQLAGVLPKLYNLTIEGIQKVNKRTVEHEDEFRLTKLESHLWAYAGDFAKAIYEMWKEDLQLDLLWVERWHKCYEKSAMIAEDIDPEHAGHADSLAADAAQIMFENTGEIRWGERWYEGKRVPADKSYSRDKEHSAHAYNFAADAAEAMYKKTGETKWLERLFDCRKMNGDMTHKTEKNPAAHSYSIAGNAAKILYERTRDTRWLRGWYECKRLSAVTDPKIAKAHVIHAYASAGDAATLLFDEANEMTEKRTWAEKALNCHSGIRDKYENVMRLKRWLSMGEKFRLA